MRTNELLVLLVKYQRPNGFWSCCVPFVLDDLDAQTVSLLE